MFAELFFQSITRGMLYFANVEEIRRKIVTVLE